jgi:hypothetical protein
MPACLFTNLAVFQFMAFQKYQEASSSSLIAKNSSISIGFQNFIARIALTALE